LERRALNDRRSIIANWLEAYVRKTDRVRRKIEDRDLKIDTVIGRNHKGALVTISNRKTNKLKILPDA
jgi:IS30 family transposase